MKYTNTLLVHLCTVLIFVACTKEDQPALTIDSPGKANKHAGDFKANLQIKTLRQEVTYPYSFAKDIYTYNFQYNKNGTINRINITRQYGSHLFSFYVANYGNGIKMDSIVHVPQQGMDQAYKNIGYKGNKITKVDLYNSRANGLFDPFPITFEYDKKGNLLNSSPWDRFIYDDAGILKRVIYKIGPSYSVTYSYDTTPNPLFIDNLFLMMINHDYFLKQFTFGRFNVSSKTSDAGVTINYYNEYDQLGRLIKKSYTEREERFELFYIY